MKKEINFQSSFINRRLDKDRSQIEHHEEDEEEALLMKKKRVKIHFFTVFLTSDLLRSNGSFVETELHKASEKR